MTLELLETKSSSKLSIAGGLSFLENLIRRSKVDRDTTIYRSEKMKSTSIFCESGDFYSITIFE